MLNFRGFEPATIETFAEHYRREVYRGLIRAVRAVRVGDEVFARHQLGRSDCCVSVLYDLNHERAYSALRRYQRVVEMLGLER